MLRSLNSAVSGLQNFQQRLDVIGNNIANVNTTGYKGARTAFADSFSQTLRSSVPATATTSNVAAMQIGIGVTSTAVQNLYSQGAITRTGITTDLAIAGDGFFVVRDTLTNDQFLTRAGDFRLDAGGFLITTGGGRVQGFNDAGLTTLGDIRVDTTGAPPSASPTATINSFGVDDSGKIILTLSDGTQFARGQILLQRVKDPQSLTKEGNNLFANVAAAGPLTAPAAPGSNSLGKIQSGALELSNVDMANEFSSLITTQRAFQASSRIITTSDEILQELVNLKR